MLIHSKEERLFEVNSEFLTVLFNNYYNNKCFPEFSGICLVLGTELMHFCLKRLTVSFKSQTDSESHRHFTKGTLFVSVFERAFSFHKFD